jgi:hypothetical protein
VEELRRAGSADRNLRVCDRDISGRGARGRSIAKNGHRCARGPNMMLGFKIRAWPYSHPWTHSLPEVPNSHGRSQWYETGKTLMFLAVRPEDANVTGFAVCRCLREMRHFPIKLRTHRKPCGAVRQFRTPCAFHSALLSLKFSRE